MFSKIFITSFFLFSFNSFAQMANSSIFSEMKSINPAVISLRPAGTFATYVKFDKSTKEQDLSSNHGPGASSKEKGSLTSLNVFYGGKGGGITLETMADISTGDLEYEFNLPDSPQGASTLKGEANAKFLGVGIGIGKYFGLSLAKSILEVDNQFTTSVTVGGTTTEINTISKAEVDSTRIRGGMRFNLGLDFGLYYEIDSRETTTVSNEPSAPPGTETDTSTIGFGIGQKTKAFHLEAFFEKRLDDTLSNGQTYSPSRYGGTIEGQLAGLTLGYTGMIFTGGFSDLERVMYDNLIYSSSLYETRLEHIFNFSFGGSGKGHSFGGSASYANVETQETSKIDTDSTQKYTTTTIVLGASVKYGYAF